MISKTDIRNIIHQLIRVSLPNDKLVRTEELKYLTPIDNVSKGVTSLHEPEFSFLIGRETPKGSKTTFSDMITLITNETLYTHYMELPSKEFIGRFNKTIYEFVSEELKADRQRNVPDEDNVWINPNSAFVNWFQENWIDIESIESFAEKKQKEFESRFGKQIKKSGGRPKGQWKKANRRYCAIGKMFENRKRLSRESNRAIASYIFMDLRDNPKKHLGEKKNPYSSAESVYDIIKRRKWETRPIG
jgi:hypothetical protein